MIGRVQEVKELNRLYSRDKAELVAIYGRRRVGKTYLVDETFADRITFRHAGLSPAEEDSKGLSKLQLNHFYNSLELQGMESQGTCQGQTLETGNKENYPKMKVS